MRRIIAVLVALVTMLAPVPAPAQAAVPNKGCPPTCMRFNEPACGEIQPTCAVTVEVTLVEVDKVTLTAYTVDGTARAGKDYIPLRKVQVVVNRSAPVVTFTVSLLPGAQGKFGIQIDPDQRMDSATATITINQVKAG